MEYPFLTASEIGQPFPPEEKEASVKFEARSVRLGSTHSSLLTEHDLERMDSMDSLLSKGGICRANPASTCKEEKLTTLYRETGPTVAEIQGRVREGGYVRASQEEVKSSVFDISNCQSALFFHARGENLLPQTGHNHR